MPKFIKKSRVIATLLKLDEAQIAFTSEKDLRQKAEDSNAAKDRFLASLSHELRTPLTPALLLAEEIECNPSVTIQVKEDAIVIKKNIIIELKLIDDLLDVAKISNKKMRLEFVDLDATAILQGVLEMLQNKIKDKQLQTEIISKATNTWISADPARFHQVLWNLISNSIKFSPEEGKITITVTNPTENELQIDIKDKGIGMESPNEKIFSLFHQGDESITRKFGGLGLGLHIALELVTYHKGTLLAFSEGLGKGSTFSLKLPVVAPHLRAATSDDIPETTPKKILLVEDNQSTMVALVRILSKLGHEVVSASCLEEALQIQNQIDLLICDIGLPDGSGLDLVKEMKAKDPSLKAIALSGHGFTEDIQRSSEAGFNVHLTKPIQTATLKWTIYKLLDGKVI